MKKFITAILCSIFVLGATAAEPIQKSDTLYILGVGNSWTRDSMRWLSAIAKSAGRPVVVGHAYLGGSTLEHQYRGIDDKTFTYPHGKYDQVVHHTYQYWLYDGTNDPVKTPDKNYRNGKTGIGVTLESVVTDKPWEVIVLQPEITMRHYVLSKGGVFDLNLLVERIKKMMRPEDVAKARFGLMVPFSYPQGNTHYRKGLCTYYNNNVEPSSQEEWDALFDKVHHCIQEDIVELGASMGNNCSFIVNVGLAIYNARQNRWLSKSGYKLQRSQSNTHLSEGLAMYIASLAYAYEILGIDRNEAHFFPRYSKDPHLTGDTGKTDLVLVENTEFLADQARREAWHAQKCSPLR